MLKFCLCFFSFFNIINSFSTEEEKVKCNICLQEKDSSLLIESKEIFSCNCNEDLLICKKCILKLIGEKINLKKEKELTENNEKIKILEIIFGYIKEEIKKENINLQNFVKKIIDEKEEIEKEENEEKTKNENIKIGGYQELSKEKKLVYSTINKQQYEDKYKNTIYTIFYIGEEKNPTEQLKFIKSFLSLLKQFNEDSHEYFKRDIENFILDNYNKPVTIEEIEKWKEKDVEIKVSGSLDTTELQKKIKKEKVIRITCPYCRREIEKESAFFLKICEELSSQESSKKLSCIEICEYLCPFCC